MVQIGSSMKGIRTSKELKSTVCFDILHIITKINGEFLSKEWERARKNDEMCLSALAAIVDFFTHGGDAETDTAVQPSDMPPPIRGA